MAAETSARELALYEHVYLPVVQASGLDPGDTLAVRAIVASAAEHGLLADVHVAGMVTALHMVKEVAGPMR